MHIPKRITDAARQGRDIAASHTSGVGLRANQPTGWAVERGIIVCYWPQASPAGTPFGTERCPYGAWRDLTSAYDGFRDIEVDESPAIRREAIRMVDCRLDASPIDGRELAELLDHWRLTAGDLAMLLDVSQRTVENWKEKGLRGGPTAALVRIALADRPV